MPDEAKHQAETAVSWGRYAELLSYDDSGMIYLEPGQADIA
ncbi:MAG: AAA-associated domain-containing protein [Anaerolineae bacterium]